MSGSKGSQKGKAPAKPAKGAAKARSAQAGGKKPEAAGAPTTLQQVTIAQGAMAAAGSEMPRLQKRYVEEIRPALRAEFGYRNVMQVPKLEKIVINMGVGEAAADQKKLDAAVAELALISGQKPIKTIAKKAIAGFKIRKGLAIGCKVTLRKARMYEFLDRLINIALPRVRDFRGLNPKSFDGRGNYSLGIKEHIIFPEIDYDKTSESWGMDITVCTTARTDDEARALLTAFNFPFRQ